MKYFIVLFLFFSFFIQAQDTLIFRKKSKTIVVNILYTTADEVIYKKMKDKVDRIFIISKAHLKSIAFRDSTVQNFEHINREEPLIVSQKNSIDTSYESRIMAIGREPNKQMFERGILDAERFYTFDEFLTNRRLSPHGFVMAGFAGALLFSSKNDSPVDITLFKYVDYRKGYRFKVTFNKLG